MSMSTVHVILEYEYISFYLQSARMHLMLQDKRQTSPLYSNINILRQFSHSNNVLRYLSQNHTPV